LPCLLVWLIASTAFAIPPKVTDRAREHFKAGVAYMEEPTGAKYEEAYREFHTAYADSPSYKILNNIALCALFLERDVEAIESYEAYLAVAPKEEIPAQKRTQIDSDLKRLKAGLVKLSIKTVPATANVVDERDTSQGKSVVNRYTTNNGELALGIHPGNHSITVKAEGYAPQTWEFEAAPASTQSHEFTLVANNAAPTVSATVADPSPAPKVVTEQPTSSKRGTPAGVYVGAVATGVFAAAATATGLLALHKKSDVVDLNKTGTHPGQAQTASDSAKRFALFCDISIGAAAIAGAATAYFYFTSPRDSKPASTAQSRWQVTPVLGTSQAGLGIVGNF